jgi:prophage regulatory protein
MIKMLRRLLRLPAVEDAVGMGKTQIYEAIERGVFPKPVPILEGGRAVGWVEDEIIAYIEARIALRDEREALRAASVEPKRRPRGRPRKKQTTMPMEDSSAKGSRGAANPPVKQTMATAQGPPDNDARVAE